MPVYAPSDLQHGNNFHANDSIYVLGLSPKKHVLLKGVSCIRLPSSSILPG